MYIQWSEPFMPETCLSALVVDVYMCECMYVCMHYVCMYIQWSEPLMPDTCLAALVIDVFMCECMYVCMYVYTMVRASYARHMPCCLGNSFIY